MATTIGALALKIKASTGDLKPGLDQNLSEIGRFAAQAKEKLGGMMKGGIAGMVAGLTVDKIAGMLDHVEDKMLEMRHAAVQLGTTMETISTLKFAAKGDFETAAHGLTKFHEHLGEAMSGAIEAQEKFTKAGLDWRGLAGIPLNDQLDAIAKKFSTFATNEEKAAFAVKIFGKAGGEMIPLLEKMGQGMDKLAEKTRKTGHMYTEIDAVTAKMAREGSEKFSWAGRVKDSALLSLDRLLMAETRASIGEKVFWEQYHKDQQAKLNAMAAEAAKWQEVSKGYEERLVKLRDPLDEFETKLAGINQEFKSGFAPLELYTRGLDKWRIDVEAALGAIGAKSPFTSFKDSLELIENAVDKLAKSGMGFDEVQAKYDRWRMNLMQGLGLFAAADPFKKYAESLDMLEAMFAKLAATPKVLAEAKASMEELNEQLFKSLGLGNEGPVEKFTRQMNEVKRLEGMGFLKQAQQLMGIAGQELLATQKIAELNRTPPAGLDYGSSAEFSARNAFQRGSGGWAGSQQEQIANALANLAKQGAEKEKNDKALLDWAKRNGFNLVKVGG